MEPIRTLQTATHFKKTADPEGKQPYLWTPCSPDDPKAKAMTLMDVKSEELHPMDVSMQDFMRVCVSAKPSVGPDDLIRYTKWTEEFGQEG